MPLKVRPPIRDPESYLIPPTASFFPLLQGSETGLRWQRATHGNCVLAYSCVDKEKAGT